MKTAKGFRTKQPQQPKVYKMTKTDLGTFRENFAAISQLIAHTNGVLEDKDNEGLKQQLQNCVQFLDDMRFLFQKLSEADAVKIEK